MATTTPTTQAAAAAEREMMACLDNDKHELFDKDLCRAYRDAMDLVPDLVHRETPVLPFLRREDYNVTAAARRFLLYWQWRRTVFGFDRAFLPLTQTGTGALTRSNIEVLRSGLFTFCPRGKHLPAIVYVDLSLMTRSVATDAMPWLFYFCTHAAHDETLQRHGIVFVHVTQPGHRMEMVPGLWQFITTALPIKFHVQQILLPVVQPGRHCLQEYLTQQATEMIKYNSGNRPHLVRANSIAQRLDILKAMGVPTDMLPSRYGGTMNADAWHADFIRMRLSLEDLDWRVQVNHCMAKPPASQAMLTAQQVHRLAHLNDGYALRKKRAKKPTLAEMQAAVRVQQEQRKIFERERDRLCTALARARYIVAVHNNACEQDLHDNHRPETTAATDKKEKKKPTLYK